MYDSLRKVELINAIEKVNDETILSAIEALLSQEIAKNKKGKKDWSKVIGIMTEEEADAMEKAIAETCNYINPNVCR